MESKHKYIQRSVLFTYSVSLPCFVTRNHYSCHLQLQFYNHGTHYRSCSLSKLKYLQYHMGLIINRVLLGTTHRRSPIKCFRLWVTHTHACTHTHNTRNHTNTITHYTKEWGPKIHRLINIHADTHTHTHSVL